MPVSTQEDLDHAVAAAPTGFKKWSKVPLEARRAALLAYADALDAHKDQFTQLLTQEQGKPLSQASTEIDFSVVWIKGAVEVKLTDTVIEDSKEQTIIQRYTPLGVAAGIVPWNYPIILAIQKVISAVYAGNCIIIKPSPYTPYYDLKLAELATQFFPPGVIQALSGDDDLGPMITAHPGIDKISFTRSTVTGRKVMASCAQTLKRVTLELGGNDPAIVCEDVDIDAVLPKIGIFTFLTSGQICVSIKRIYVHERIYDEFCDKLVAFAKSLKIGAGTDPDTFFGPIQNAMQYEKAKDLIGSIASENLTIALDGKIEGPEGYFIHPVIVDNPPETSRVVVEEPFAPIIPLMKWSEEDDMIARANDTGMGLGASVWGKDAENC